MTGDQEYYSEKLSAERLKKCYDIAPSRVRQYLDAEISLTEIDDSSLFCEISTF
jgi:hypothetical protein